MTAKEQPLPLYAAPKRTPPLRPPSLRGTPCTQPPPSTLWGPLSPSALIFLSAGSRTQSISTTRSQSRIQPRQLCLYVCACAGGVGGGGGGVSGPASMCYKGPEVWFTFQARQQLIFIEQISCRWVGRCWDEQSSNMEKQQIIDLWDLICRVNLLFLKTNKQKKCFGARNDLAAVDIVRHFSDQKEPRQVPHWLGRLRIILLPH